MKLLGHELSWSLDLQGYAINLSPKAGLVIHQITFEDTALPCITWSAAIIIDGKIVARTTGEPGPDLDTALLVEFQKIPPETRRAWMNQKHLENTRALGAI